MADRTSGTPGSQPGLARYDLGNLVRTALRFGPGLVEHAGALRTALLGDERLPLEARVALHLRLARLLRCPLCLVAFPALARVAGLTGPELDAAVEGHLEALRPELAQVVAWGAAVALARGEMPLEWPPEARRLTMRQREQVLLITRLELLIHSAGLLVVPEPLLGVDATTGGTGSRR